MDTPPPRSTPSAEGPPQRLQNNLGAFRVAAGAFVADPLVADLFVADLGTLVGARGRSAGWVGESAGAGTSFSAIRGELCIVRVFPQLRAETASADAHLQRFSAEGSACEHAKRVFAGVLPVSIDVSRERAHSRRAYDACVKLRLYHHSDGARVAYRESGAGPALALLHSGLLSHKEWEPVVEHLSDRFRVVLPDLPLHGDSEDRPRHPYTLDWFAEVMAGFAADVLGPRPIIGGHGAGAEILLHAVRTRRLAPARLVLMSNRMHRPGEHRHMRSTWRLAARTGALPGVNRMLTHAARATFIPELGVKLSARSNPAARDLVRHALADVPGNPNLARSWAKCARAWPCAAHTELLELYPQLELPVLLLWADRDRMHPLIGAEEALGSLPHGQLRVLESTGFLMAYDDPVGLARELAAFCG